MRNVIYKYISMKNILFLLLVFSTCLNAFPELKSYKYHFDERDYDFISDKGDSILILCKNGLATFV